MKYSVTEKNQCGTVKAERYQVVAKNNSGYESRILVEPDDFNRIQIGDTIEILLTVVPVEVAA